MAIVKTLIGNVKGPQGDKGDKGTKGDKGATGSRGSRWTEGTAITGTSTTPTVFSGSGITDALADDQYLNTATGNVYRCTSGGAADVAEWVYACNLKGVKGDAGAKGDTGAKGDQGEKGDTGAQGPKGDTPTVADGMTVAFTQASSRANIATGEKMNTIMGKIKKWFDDMTVAAFAQVITNNADLMALTTSGYLVDALAVKNQFSEVNSKLGMQMYSIIDDSYLNKSLMDIILEMPNKSELLNPYIKCAEKQAIMNLGFSQYSIMMITKYDEWQIWIMIVGMHGSPIGFWLGNRNSADIVSEISVYKS